MRKFSGVISRLDAVPFCKDELLRSSLAVSQFKKKKKENYDISTALNLIRYDLTKCAHTYSRTHTGTRTHKYTINNL